MSPKTIALIPARSGSVGLPHKNIKKVGGVSLIDRAIQHAIKVDAFDEIVVTTDIPATDYVGDPTIKVLERPLRLRGSEVSMVEVLHDVISSLGLERQDRIVLLQPTSPFREVSATKKVIGLLEEFESVVTVKKLRISPNLIFETASQDSLNPAP